MIALKYIYCICLGVVFVSGARNIVGANDIVGWSIGALTVSLSFWFGCLILASGSERFVVVTGTASVVALVMMNLIYGNFF